MNGVGALTGQVALVAGATRGAGRAIAVEFARAGFYAGMIQPWIRRRGSGSARRAAARFRRSVAEAPVLRGSGRCAPTATTRRYHE